MLEIRDSVAVITGGGIGKALARYWVENGGRVLLTDVVPAPLEAAKKEMEALQKIVADVPIGRLVEPEEVASLVGELYRNEALAGEVFFIHGGLRLGSRG